MKYKTNKAIILFICSIATLALAGCGARSDQTSPEMAQNMLKIRGFNFNETEFFRALKLGDGVAVKGFLQGGINPNAKDKEGETALTFAIQHDEAPIIKLLIEKADINLRDDLGNSPLHLALKENKDQIFDLLLEKGADVNLPGRASEKTNDQTALYLAVARNDADLVRRLLERGADPNLADSAGSLPLVEAVVDSDADPEIVKMLIEKGADVNKTEKENGASALIFIAQNSQVPTETRVKIVKFLLEKGADRSIRENDGKTALDWAKEKKNTETVELLK
ncbi:MAG: ankyrin repeat domain-containing protein [Pyrinomonadaceae bacterium]